MFARQACNSFVVFASSSRLGSSHVSVRKLAPARPYADTSIVQFCLKKPPKQRATLPATVGICVQVCVTSHRGTIVPGVREETLSPDLFGGYRCLLRNDNIIFQIRSHREVKKGYRTIPRDVWWCEKPSRWRGRAHAKKQLVLSNPGPSLCLGLGAVK